MWPFAKRPPTDFEVLQAIYLQHRDDYVASPNAAQGLFPIDLAKIAKQLGVEQVSLEGRLYYDLGPRYTQTQGELRSFYGQFPDGSERVNFPILEAVVAGLWQERNRNRWAIGLAIASFVISVGAIAVTGYTTLWT